MPVQHLLFIVLQLHTSISMRVGDEVSTPKCLLCQNVYCAKMSTPKISTVPKCLLWQNDDSQNVYSAKMSTVQKCPLLKCQLPGLKPEGPFRKEISLIYKEFSRHLGILLKTLQRLCIMSLFTGKCMILSIFYQLFAFFLPKLHAWGYIYILYTLAKRS